MEIGARQLRSWRANLVFGARQMRVTCDKTACMQSTARAHLLAAGADGAACLVHADQAQHLSVLGAQGRREVGHCHPGHAGGPWLPHERGAQRSEPVHHRAGRAAHAAPVGRLGGGKPPPMDVRSEAGIRSGRLGGGPRVRVVGGGQKQPRRHPLLHEEDVPHVGHRWSNGCSACDAKQTGWGIASGVRRSSSAALCGGGGGASASTGAAGLSSASGGASGMSSSWGSGTGSTSSAALCGGGGGIRISRRGRPVLRIRRRLRHVDPPLRGQARGRSRGLPRPPQTRGRGG